MVKIKLVGQCEILIILGNYLAETVILLKNKITKLYLILIIHFKLNEIGVYRIIV